LLGEEGVDLPGEVITMMGALADIQPNTLEILAILDDEEEGDEEEEVDT
jgi:hypothetical protein